ncbi:DUF3630 family protein [Endozoicomonas acroporae]|uniref:DUF3630 family protein n=1 Tax=Endozoicomonas acroporae TaxID=1701104 RepID=UPI003D7AEAEE
MDTLFFVEGYPRLQKMASGHLSLELSDKITLDEFPEFANRLISVVGGIVEEKNHSVIMCIWDVSINDKQYRLVYDDYPCGVSLESDNDDSDREIYRIKSLLEGRVE